MLSVVIPVFNEEKFIGQSLKIVFDHAAVPPEVIVVDGQSTDGTCCEVQKFHVKLLQPPGRGRAFQMYTAAAGAAGDVLLFLHADSVPPPGYDKLILAAVEAGALAGCFQLRFSRRTAFFKFFEFFTRFPFLLCRGGDQGLFITKALYKRIGGFNPNLLIMEDIDIIKRIKKQTHFTILTQKIETSTRKYDQHGAFGLQMRFAVVHFLYWWGVSDHSIYHRFKKYIQKT
ncbi:MAG: TIGR04283 family arsenosugar biosynthesis glycosyltransferase [Flavobacteriales bacterium]|nr:TIGR04283 family arsenosugar biosynthesis glycosyltransferase [Flavobacteriales bacterium]